MQDLGVFTPYTRGDEKNVLTNPDDKVRTKARLNVVAIGVKCAGNRSSSSSSSSQRIILMLRRSIRDTVVRRHNIMVLSFER